MANAEYVKKAAKWTATLWIDRTRQLDRGETICVTSVHPDCRVNWVEIHAEFPELVLGDFVSFQEWRDMFLDDMGWDHQNQEMKYTSERKS